MQFTIGRDVFLKALGHAHGIIEKKTTLPILSNILIEAKNSKIKITGTDLDIIYSEEIPLLELKNLFSIAVLILFSIKENTFISLSSPFDNPLDI